VVVSENPHDHDAFLSAFTGVRADSASASGITASTARGEISVMDPVAFRSRLGLEPPDVSRGARLAAVQFRVRDRAALSAALERGGIAASSARGATIVGPQRIGTWRPFKGELRAGQHILGNRIFRPAMNTQYFLREGKVDRFSEKVRRRPIRSHIRE
jgi:hypothetical protein